MLLQSGLLTRCWCIHAFTQLNTSKELTGSKGKLASIPQGDQQAKQVEHVPVICESLGVSGTVGTVIIMDTQNHQIYHFFQIFHSFE